MKKSEIQHVLSAPIVRLKPSAEREKYLLGGDVDAEKNGHYYTFKLASGVTFVAYVSMLREYYRFFVLDAGKTGITLKNVWWEKSPSQYAYNTKVVSQGDVAAYHEVLEDKTSYLSEPNFEGSGCHPLLEKAKQLRQGMLECQQARQALLKAQEDMRKLLVPEKSGKGPGHPLGIGNTAGIL